MRREVSISVFAVLILIAAFLTVYYLNIRPTGFVIVGEDSTNFNTAGMVNLSLVNNSLVLSANQTSGTYTSKIFDGSFGATWNSLASQGSGVDFQVKVCSSSNCSDANFSAPGNLSNLSLSGQYFQYRASFDSVNDTLTSVSVDYTAAQQPPVALAVSISEPAGEKTSLTGIPLTFTITGGTGINLSCSYNINYAGGPLVQNASVSCATGSNTKTFDLASKGGDNILTLYVSDTSGSASASSPVFQISVPSGGTITGETTEEELPPLEPQTPSITEVSLGAVQSQDVNEGGSGQFTVSVQNTGTVPLTSCVIRGDDSGWFSITGGAINLNTGEGSTYSFSVNVPDDTSLGVHTLGLSVDCAETTTSQTFTVNVLQKKLDLNITNVLRTRQDRVRVDYTITELAGQDQDVQILFTITDTSGAEVANASQNSSIDANETDDFRVNIPINETLEGNLTLSAAFNSQVYSSTVLEPISLGPVTGGAIFGEGGAGGIIVVLVVAAVIVAVLFVARRMRKSAAEK